jgi:hypothetical protein
MSATDIELQKPVISPFGDGDYTGTAHNTPPGNIGGYGKSRHFWEIPSVTSASTALNPIVTPRNKRVIYVNGIGTPMMSHAYTVKLLAYVSGCGVVGIYNQSGDGTDTNIFYDLVQCLGDKTGLSNNPATKTMAKAVFDGCVSGVYVNIVAHSQGAIITSRALRQAIGMLLDRYGRMNSKVNALFQEVEKRRGFWESVGRGMVNANDRDRMLLEIALKQEILPLVEKRLGDFVSVQTFGGAGRFFPNGPMYRHVVNAWDPVPNAFGQGDIMTGPGRGAVVQTIDRNAGSIAPDFDDHSMDGVYLQNSQYFVDRNGKKVDTNYIAIDQNRIR